MSDKLNFSQIQDFQLNLADKALKESQTEIAQLRAEFERLRSAARLPDPTYASTDGRVCCVYCGSIEENGHSEACPWVKLNVLLSLDRDKPITRA